MTLFTKTYESITKSFVKVIDDLEALIAKNIQKGEDKTAEIKALKAECIALEEEATKARNTVEKIRGLLE